MINEKNKWLVWQSLKTPHTQSVYARENKPLYNLHNACPFTVTSKVHWTSHVYNRCKLQDTSSVLDAKTVSVQLQAWNNQNYISFGALGSTICLSFMWIVKRWTVWLFHWDWWAAFFFFFSLLFSSFTVVRQQMILLDIFWILDYFLWYTAC